MRISDWSSDVCSSDLLFIALQQRAKVLWQRPDMADVDMADVAALRPLAAHRLMDRPEGRSPAHDRQPAAGVAKANILLRSEEHTSELQSLMRISYAVFCLKKKKKHTNNKPYTTT